MGKRVLALAAALVATACGGEHGASDHGSAGDLQVGSSDLQVGEVAQALGQSPELGCTTASYGGHDYWFCPTIRTWSSARTKCENQGYNLVRIEDVAENSFVKSHMPLDAWIGANDVAAEGTWTWTFGGSNFWTGNASGHTVNGLFADWSSGQPDNIANQDCGKLSLSGKWSDESCGLLFQYVCESGTDQCSQDPNKVVPGACGCGVSDVDTDGDGTPDCHDQCPNDATKIRPGDCGCSDAPRVSGTPCSDGLCAANTTCNGAGVCGNPSSCPAPDTNCTFGVLNNAYYWFCNHDRTFADARHRCQTAGMDATAIESAVEDEFIESKVPQLDHVFIGGGDDVTEGTFVWKATGKQFWSGGPNGSATGGAYTDWESGEPSDFGNKDCMAKDPPINGGEWEARSCTLQEGYVCEQVDLCPNDPDKLNPGQCGCGVPDQGDPDHDGVFNCIDKCPFDSTKTAPGLCGCGTPETDLDGDGIPGCRETCDNDATKTSAGDCGCAPNYAPAGKACADGVCPGTATCNGSGQCGDPQACAPAPGCTYRIFNHVVYWLCTGTTVGWDTAAANCAAKGQTLARVDSSDKNAFVAHLVGSGKAWVGANDKTTEASWYWSNGSNPSDTLFFQNGTRFDNAFLAWGAGSPGGGTAENCGAIDGASATWSDESCSLALKYVCESPYVPGGLPPHHVTCSDFMHAPGCTDTNSDHQGDTDPNCVPESVAFVDAQGVPLNHDDQRFNDLVVGCNQNCPTGNESECATFCAGAASIPPQGSTCQDFSADNKAKCVITDVDLSSTCGTDADCQPGFICATNYTCAACDTRTATPDLRCNALCTGAKHCGHPAHGCAQTSNQPGPLCQDVRVCMNPANVINSDPFSDPATNLLTRTVNHPDIPDPGPQPYPDDPFLSQPQTCGTPLRVNHPWCHYGLNNPLANQSEGDTPADDKKAQSGVGSLIQFNFDPNMNLDFDLNPKPIGEFEPSINASASFLAQAKIQIVGAVASVNIVEAIASIEANRCHAKSVLKLSLFDNDLLPTLIPSQAARDALNFNVPEQALQDDCQQAVANLDLAVDKAKKALRDAQDLLRQYNEIKTAGNHLDPVTFCQTVTANAPVGFPFGNCSTDSVETTINRFIQFYSRSTIDYWQGDIEITGGLQGALSRLKGKYLNQIVEVPTSNNSENWKIAQAQFFLGPIPMTMQLEAFVDYGLGGGIEARVTPNLPTDGNPGELASIRVEARPHADAGLSLFVGAGFSAGPFEASAGVDGRVTIGELSLPAHAQAGVVANAITDERTIPPSQASSADGFLFPLEGPKKYQFGLSYDYGAVVELSKVLKGSLSAEVRVAFLFFSKTWSQKLVEWDGFFQDPPKTFTLFSNKGRSFAAGQADWGMVRMPMPFVKLKALDTTTTNTAGTAVPVSLSCSEKIFYQELCVCLHENDPCQMDSECCPDLFCRVPLQGGQGTCQAKSVVP